MGSLGRVSSSGWRRNAVFVGVARVWPVGVVFTWHRSEAENSPLRRLWANGRSPPCPPPLCASGCVCQSGLRPPNQGPKCSTAEFEVEQASLDRKKAGLDAERRTFDAQQAQHRKEVLEQKLELQAEVTVSSCALCACLRGWLFMYESGM